jgi:hypothetical protein
MPTGYGTIYNDGVKYLKINKFDANGTDKSDYLAQMTSIRINHGDVGTLQYNISTTQLQNDYFIFGLTFPQSTTSSIGDILDYTLVATSTQPASTTIPTTYGTVFNFGLPSCSIASTGSGVYGTLTGLPQNYLVWNLTQTPNIILSATASLNVTNTNAPGPGTGRTVQFYLTNGGAGIENVIANAQSATITAGTSVPLTLSFEIPASSIEPLISSSGYIFGIYASDTGCTLSTGIINLNLKQSPTIFNGSSSLIIFNPDSINFDYNDYNPLLDNAETPQYSTTWMDVDYSQNPLTPINFGLIISGTADRAFVQDSNYSSKAWSNIRYNGSRTTSYRINQ